MTSSGQLFVARLIVAGTVCQVIEFEASDATRAWVEANDGIDPLSGMWVEVHSRNRIRRAHCSSLERTPVRGAGGAGQAHVVKGRTAMGMKAAAAI